MIPEKSISLRIAVPAPLRQLFDYLPPNEGDWQALKPGMRVQVPFQRRELIGIFVGFSDTPDVPMARLKRVSHLIDTNPLISSDVFALCQWAADYYHYPIGEVLAHALPGLLRKGKPLSLTQETYWILTAEGLSADETLIKRAPKQIALLQQLKQHPAGMSAKQLRKHDIPKSIVQSLVKKGWIAATTDLFLNSAALAKPPLLLNSAQQLAVDAIVAAKNTFQVFLLDGITGSGKTEVYLQALAKSLADQKQVLVLVPEIGLTPQTIQRFKERFTVPVVALHSGLSEKERLNAWHLAQTGAAKIVIGTRSAIFTPFLALGLIIVDEEHDLSFKQQDSFRYHARDLAIMRARLNQIPIVLGSATPALETLHNTQTGKYQHLLLPMRAGNAELPEFNILDIRKETLNQGLSQPLINEIKIHLARNEQVMLFLNRRGFAPVLLCHACGYIADCKRCDMRMTYHQQTKRLHCHHCDSQKPLPRHCERCHDKTLLPIGLGTERLEHVLQTYFPDVSIARVDRDNTQRKGAMDELMQGIHSGKHSILLGTQMLAKGHHFPNVTLVCIVDADGGFFGSDFRALERMGQLLLQVSGRAGRADKKGKVIIQTHHPEHPLLHQLLYDSYHQFALSILKERFDTSLPPYSYFALLRAEAYQLADAHEFLHEVKKMLQFSKNDLQCLGPINAPMPRKAGRHRVQLLIQSKQRSLLQQFLKNSLPEIDHIPLKKQVRWSLDVDPLEMF